MQPLIVQYMGDKISAENKSRWPHSPLQPLIKQYMGDEFAAKNAYHLQPLHRVYLYGESDFNPAAEQSDATNLHAGSYWADPRGHCLREFYKSGNCTRCHPQARSRRAKSRWRASPATDGSVLELNPCF